MEIDFHDTSHLRTPKLLCLVVYASLFPFISCSQTTFENTTFNFSSFSPNMHEITYESDASASNLVIQLTEIERDKRPSGSCGRAIYKELLHLWDKASGSLADFTIHFSFMVDSQNSTSYSDGFAFFLAYNGSSMPPDSYGGNLGLVSNDPSFNSMKTSSIVAIEYDTYTNAWDPPYDHVGINFNSMVSVNTVRWWSDIRSGRRTECWVSYNSTSKNLSALLTDGVNVSTLDYVTDLRDYLSEWITFGFSACTGASFEKHTICSWDFNSSLKISPNTPINPGSSERSLHVGLGVGAAALVVLVALMVLFRRRMWWKRREKEDDRVSLKKKFEEENRNRSEEEFGEQNRENADIEFQKLAGLQKFSFSELDEATNKFAKKGMLGEGGSGSVYKGDLGDITVAIKRIKPESPRGMKQFESEVKAISQLRHRNLVLLKGWCHEQENLLIVYEFIPNKSLDLHLFKEDHECVLTWERRFTIALNLASALFYLQEHCEQCVLHRDIKSSNVLLDLNFNAKLGDFGLARLVKHGDGSQTTCLMGTKGYVAPEYAQSGEATKESDIYSFGIVALEIACGKPALENIKENGKKIVKVLVDQVWEHYGKRNVFGAVDPRLCQNYEEEQMKQLIIVGLSCAHPDPNKRPPMQLVIDMLKSKAPLPELPSEMPTPIQIAPPMSVSALLPSSSHVASGSQIS